MCSNRIFVPIQIRINPPSLSADFSQREPSFAPKETPKKEKTKVVIPITAIVEKIGVFKIAKETPATRASMLVAKASSNIGKKEKSEVIEDSFLKDSIIILMPMKANIAKATQWSKHLITPANLEPRK